MKYLIFAIPLIIIADLYTFSLITELMRQASDRDVFIGLLLASLLFSINFILIRIFLKYYKKQSK